jgi:hypothetical protein
MKIIFRQKGSLSQKTKFKTKIIVGAFAFGSLLAIGWLIAVNISNNTESIASPTVLNNGDIISRFIWERDEPTKAATGPDAISISKNAYIAFGGSGSTGGLAPGVSAKDINMEIPASSVFDIDGIDISIDFRCNEPSGSFYTRGKTFDFGFNKGYLSITYKTQSLKGTEIVSQATGYEMLNDNVFRNYRFIYTPVTGKGEIFVNNVIVWSNEGEHNAPMAWNTKENIIVGKGIDGGGIDTPVLDNLTIRTSGSVSPLAESLVNFMLKAADGCVTINWSTTANNKVNSFTIQRSVNGFDFATIGTLKSDPSVSDVKEYTFMDRNFSNPGVYYYRIKQTFNDGKFVTHNISATKVTLPDGLAIEQISPPQFDKSFSVAYNIPEEGKVQWQLVDETGKIKTYEIVAAQKGKNIYQFNAADKLTEGTYTLNLLFNDKKLSATVTKI